MYHDYVKRKVILQKLFPNGTEDVNHTMSAREALDTVLSAYTPERDSMTVVEWAAYLERVQPRIMKKAAWRRIECLNLSARSYNIFVWKYPTIGDLVRLPPRALLNIYGVSPRTLAELRDRLDTLLENKEGADRV